MHELSIAQNIVETVYQNVPLDELNRVRQVVVKAGQFSGVVSDSLKFSFRVIVAQTELESAELEIVEVPFRLKCNSCGRTTANDFGIMICGECSSSNTEIISGNELEIIEVRIAEPETMQRQV
jgi:hydrogenase nickel incorporation protein HypA/HybF